MFITLLVKFITLSGSITLLEQNIIIDIFQGIPLIFMAAILKIVIRIPLGILSGFLQDRLTKKKDYYIIG